MNNIVTIAARIIVVLRLLLLRIIIKRSTVNKCNARNAYPTNHKTSATDTNSICCSIPKAK